MNPLISIITLNYNQLKVTCEFLDSLKKLNHTNYEVILIDNASRINPTSEIKKNYPDVRFIRNEKNLGFSGGNNVGIKNARGDYYFIVNNDTEVTEDLLDELLRPFIEEENIGMVSPKIRYFHHPKIIQYAGFKEINPVTGRNKIIGQYETDYGQHDLPGTTPYGHGAAMMVKKEVVDHVGFLPDIFFLYYEELDWSARIRRAGYKIMYQPSALIYHKESMSVGKESPLKAYYQNRNRILFMRRNTSRSNFLYFILFLTFVSVPKNALTYIIKGKFIHLKNFWEALVWNLLHSSQLS